ncbi:hypothetical protein, partial [Succinimonas amylolytica]|uniref:hypothetical protein n=1 Tax=Succinimonas amylolytica TaxID=83769 RepID=UPI0023A8183B
FNFIQTTENNILRYICKKFPFVLDCIYDDDKKIVKNAVIVSYIDSSYYLFSPAKVSYLLPLFVLDDVLGDDFFCDFDFLCINKKYLSQVEKAVDILLKANENKLLGICPLVETKDKHFSQIVNDFDNASYQRFIISIRRLHATNFVANNYRTLIIVLAIIVLSLVILYKFNVFMMFFDFKSL